MRATPGTGLRNRFFFIILSSLIVAAVLINLVHAYFFKYQKMRLIDRQIAEISELLLKSDEFLGALDHATAVDESITKALRGLRIGKVFVIQDANGRIVYQSFNVGHLEATLPIEPEWVTVETETEYVRLRNIKVGYDGHILQVGLVLDLNFLNWEIIDDRLLLYVVGIVVALFLVSVFLTLVLLAPLRQLISYLNEATSNLTNLKNVRSLPKKLTKFTDGHWAKSDEFSNLLSTVQQLIRRINLNYKLTRSWTLQMAHELKTPLAVIRAEAERQKKNGKVPQEFADEVIQEVGRMSDTVNQFLDWAELENTQLARDLHALRMGSVMNGVVERLNKLQPGRLKLKVEEDFSFLANPIHVEQLASNLVTNSMKFSPKDQAVELHISKYQLLVKDFGPGLPSSVIERMGEPFNVGTHTQDGATGTGLGLAWVSTVAKLYQWNFQIRREGSATVATVDFPNDDILQ